MKKVVKQLIILYLIIILLKMGLAYFILAPSAFSDDYGYSKLARSIWHDQTLTPDGIITSRPPLYPVLLSPSYVFNDMKLVFFFMKFINAVLSSLIILPAFFISKEFFSEKKSLVLTIIIVILPSHFCFTFFLMQENLFYPLFLFSIYFIYKSFIKESLKWDLLAGIFIGLAYLTKINALILPIVVILVFLLQIFRREYKEIGKKFVMAFSFFVTISPWLIRNSLLFGFNKNLLLGSYGRTLEAATSSLGWDFLLIFSIWFIMYLGYLMISSGFVFFISNFLTFKQFKDKKIFTFSILTLFSTILLICLASRTFIPGLIINKTIFPWFAGKMMGRYIEMALPLILINGLIGLKYLKKISKFYIISIVIILAFSSQLIFFPLFPINNMSLAWLGTLKFIFDFLIYGRTTILASVVSYIYSILFLIILTIILFLTIYLKTKLNTKKLLYIFIIFFSLVSLLNFAIIYYNSYTFWYKSEQTQLGLWFNNYDPKTSTILFDERDGCKIFKTNQTCVYNPITGGGFATIIGFWMNDNLKVGSVDDLTGIDYVVSRHTLALPLLKKTENGIFLYKVNRGTES